MQHSPKYTIITHATFSQVIIQIHFLSKTLYFYSVSFHVFPKTFGYLNIFKFLNHITFATLSYCPLLF